MNVIKVLVKYYKDPYNIKREILDKKVKVGK